MKNQNQEKTVVCSHCSETFQATSPIAKYCSSICRSAAWRNAKRTVGTNQDEQQQSLTEEHRHQVKFALREVHWTDEAAFQEELKETMEDFDSGYFDFEEVMKGFAFRKKYIVSSDDYFTVRFEKDYDDDDNSPISSEDFLKYCGYYPKTNAPSQYIIDLYHS